MKDVPIVVRAVTITERGEVQEVMREPLRQGYAPRRQVREAQFKPVALHGLALEGEEVVLTYEVAPLRLSSYRSGIARASDSAVDIVRQRLAAYAVVTSAEGVLLTQLSQETGRPGLWILPGGGVELGEDPRAGVVREVWEESGQDVELGDVVDIASSHRVGPGRQGLVEDFHAVRLVFRATCPHPAPPVVHDVGGSTARAAWFAVSDVIDPSAPGYPSGGMAPWALEAVRSFATG